jgi:Tail fiber protein gp32
MADITSANSVFTLNIPDVFSTPQTLQGYATDDGWATETVEIAETMLGVDGIMSYGYLPFIIHQTIVFQADSISIPDTMEAWISAEIAVRGKYRADGTLVIPSLNKVYQLGNGVITRMTPVPAGKRVLGPQTYQIDWNYWAPQPYSSV